MRSHVTLEAPREVLGERDAVALDGQVDVEARRTQQEVPHGAAHQVHPAHARGDGLDLAQKMLKAELAETSGEIGGDWDGSLRLVAVAARLAGHRPASDRAQDVAAGATAPSAPCSTTKAQPASSCAILSTTRSNGVSASTTVRCEVITALTGRVPKAVGRGAIQIDQGHAPDKTLLRRRRRRRPDRRGDSGWRRRRRTSSHRPRENRSCRRLGRDGPERRPRARPPRWLPAPHPASDP